MKRMHPSKKYCVISHTHWDREWYLTFENFRMRLVDLINHLLEILEEDPSFRFHLDAQTILLDDYLTIFPEKFDLISQYVKGGRILIGPWYVQNDFFLTSGEATIRNLLIGIEKANTFGQCMKVGYAADQFGLISQLPQILNGFGMDTCVFGRGYDRGDTEFIWKTEDGSSVLCEHMKFWYNNAQRLPSNVDGALFLVRSKGEECARFCKTSNYLLMNGVDHLEAQEDLSEILKNVNEKLNDDEYLFQDTLPEFMQRLRQEIHENGIILQEHQGELRDNGADSCLTGTLSSRIYLKRENAECQALIEKRLEPLYAMLSMLGFEDYPRNYCRYIWQTLIQNHPHDSICGCSIDPVHRHMMDRFATVRENIRELVERGMTLLMDHIDRQTFEEGSHLLLCANTSQRAFDGVNTAEIDIPCESDTGCFALYDQDNREIPFVTKAMQHNISRRTMSPINLPGEKKVNRYTIAFRTEIPEMSYRVLKVLPQLSGEQETVAQKPIDLYTMCNEYLTVEISSDGAVRLTDNISGRIIEDLIRFEDNLDAGDNYNYFENDGSTLATVDKNDVVVCLDEENELQSSRLLKFHIDVNHKYCAGRIPIALKLILKKGSRYLETEIKVDNPISHHRLRMLVNTGVSSNHNYSGQPFDVYCRPMTSRYHNDKTHPATDFVGIEDHRHGLACFIPGIYEYEQISESGLALTILRATERICGSIEDELTGSSSWLTPEAACIGEHTFKVGIYPYAGHYSEAEVITMSSQFVMPPCVLASPCDRTVYTGGRPFVQAPGLPDIFVRPLRQAELVLPVLGRIFSVECGVPDGIIVSAFKGAEKKSSMILRLYNTQSVPVAFSIDFHKKVRKASIVALDESVVEEVDMMDNRIRYQAKPKQIVSFELIL